MQNFHDEDIGDDDDPKYYEVEDYGDWADCGNQEPKYKNEYSNECDVKEKLNQEEEDYEFINEESAEIEAMIDSYNEPLEDFEYIDDDPSNSDYLNKLIHQHEEEDIDSYLNYLIDAISNEKDFDTNYESERDNKIYHKLDFNLKLNNKEEDINKDEITVSLEHQQLENNEICAEESITKYIIEALKDPDKDARKEAAKTLGLIGSMGSVKYLKEILDDPEPAVRASAIKAIGIIHKLNKKD